MGPICLTTGPTPVRQLVRTAGSDLWLKDDGLVSPLYGGNKVRKLEAVLPHILRRRASRILTLGAAGSHHVLATALFARRYSVPTHALLLPQPWSAHAEATLRATVATCERVEAATSAAAIPRWLLNCRRGDYVLAPGASTHLGALGVARGVSELRAQIEAHELPEPDLIVTPLGSGGTAAGLLAGALLQNLKCRIVAVQVTRAPGLRWLVLRLARAALRAAGFDASWSTLGARLVTTRRYCGSSYGARTEAGEAATRRSSELGLQLDVTYTAKAFAAALDATAGCLLETAPVDNVLYWHTLSAQPPASCAPEAAFSAPLPAALDALLPRT